MDATLLSLLVSFILASVLYYLLPLFRSQKTPPGRIGLQFFGETRDFVSAGLEAVPERFIFERVKKYSSTVVRTSLVGEPMAIFCGPEANKFIFSNENKLVRNWWPRRVNILFGSPDNSGEANVRNVRKIFSYLTMDALQKYVPIMDSMTKQHLQTYWEGRDVVTVHPLSKFHAVSISCRLVLGTEDEATVAKFQTLLSQLTSGVLSLPVNIPGTSFNRALKAKAELRKYVNELIKKFKGEFREESLFNSRSILADLLKESAEEDGIADKLLSLIIAAYDTTSGTLTSMIMFLGRLPHVYDKVMAEQREIARSKDAGELLNWRDIQNMKYTWNVACEVLRVYPPRVIFREVLSDFTYEGFFIPKGWKLHFSPLYTHKNPTYFPDPEKFDPSRFEGDGPAPYTYIPFGGGPRMCPGKEFTRVQLLVFIHNVVTKFKWEQIDPDEKMVYNNMLVPAKGLPVRLHPHK